MKKINVFEMALCAVMASLSIVLEKFVSLDLGLFKVTFYGLPLLIVGIIYGAKMGFITGVITGVVLQLTSKYGISLTSPFWALAPIAWGGVSGMLFKKFKFKKTYVSIFFSVLCASLMATFLNTIAMIFEMLLINDEYYTMASIMLNLPVRLISGLILIIPYTIITELLRKSLVNIYIRR